MVQAKCICPHASKATYRDNSLIYSSFVPRVVVETTLTITQEPTSEQHLFIPRPCFLPSHGSRWVHLCLR